MWRVDTFAPDAAPAMFRLSFRAKILLLVVGIVGLLAASVMVFTNLRVEAALLSSEDRAATNTVELIALDLSSRYDGLLHDKLKTLQTRRGELEASGLVLSEGIEGFKALATGSLLRDEDARAAALAWMNRIAFPRGRLAFVYDSALKVMSFPQPEVIGRDLAGRTDFKGRPLAAAMLAESRSLKRSFATFRWPRANGSGSDTKFALFSYIPQWDWVLVVADDVQDIEIDVNQGLEQIKSSMTETLQRLTIAQSGFAFVFDGKGAMVVPPRPEHAAFLALKDAPSGQSLIDLVKSRGSGASVRALAFVPDGPGMTPWEARATYFKALDWYVTALVPRADLSAPALSLLREQGVIFAIVLVLGLAIAYFSSSRLVRPLNLLATYARLFPQRDLSADWVPSTRISAIAQRHSGDEISRLAETFLSMERQLHQKLRELMNETASRQRIESELAIAREIQTGFLPDLTVELGGRRDIDVAAVVRPAKEVGGDLWDVFLVNETTMCLTVGDVSGKGVPAAFFMGIARTLLRASAEAETDPGAILARVNDALSRNNPNMMFVTMFVGILDLATGALRYANAGHPPPALTDPRGGVRRLDGEGGPACGIMPGMDYPSASDRVQPGATLTVFTDGVPDMLDEQGHFFSEARAIEVIAGLAGRSAQETVDVLLETSLAFAGTVPQADDLTILVIRRPDDAQPTLEP